MTPTEFRECLASLRWSQRGLADILNIHPTSVRNMASGKNPIPENIADWLINSASYLKIHSLPEGWQ